jgi:hypothetical protein
MARTQPGPAEPAAFETLVVNAETTLTNEFAGWVQQMNDAMRELKNRQANAANQNGPADSSHHPPAAAGPGDPPANPDQGCPVTNDLPRRQRLTSGEEFWVADWARVRAGAGGEFLVSSPVDLAGPGVSGEV